MSEPVQKGEIDLTSLDQALNDGEAASKVSAETLQKNSDTLSQPPADVGKIAAASQDKVPSPATLSPSSPRAMSPSTATTQPMAELPPAVAELKLMFPDLDNDTIAAVLASRGGDQEGAVNALLQMSDPEFKPSTTETRTDSDALLAQSMAMEEEQRHHEAMARQAQQAQQASMGRGGGGAGAFFGGLLNSDARDTQTSSAPSYDPNALTYQPRVRRGAPGNAAGAAAAGARASYLPPNHPPPPAASPSYERGDSVIPGMPGAKEAKQWQEEINRMAETGLARAATTFSNFRQKASAAFNNPQDGQGQPGAAGTTTTSTGTASGPGFAQAFQNFRNNATGRGSSTSSQGPTTTSATSPHQFTSPRTPQASEYDQDPSPVSENELAKIIQRGGGSGGSSNNASAGKARALAERYGLGIKNGGRDGAGAAQSGTTSTTGASDFAGWDQAGRTPISISDNTTPKASEGKASMDSIARMDAASGRGITSPRLDRSPSKERATGGKVGAAAVGGAAVGAGVGAALGSEHDDGDADGDGDSDDLEYVSNPFEDED
ncbi:Ubiquitin system component Cue [Kalmanozyma brasiliensis GHG001]|uniref:CUE domain-containing protein n=1 Tax=Kalmanozyma brasiliensis (strain GHG001) TaxID=1365824 RepID=V5ETR2_KALBG|nr:Ubiquitin system component Cue [Kalmanozyma brasiliensis GHG001]EST06468.1 Ubiquitin system component Cue [Kalmanozyma brasiliensis GHG001]